MLFLAAVYILAAIGALSVVTCGGLILGIGIREWQRARASRRMDHEVAQIERWLALHP